GAVPGCPPPGGGSRRGSTLMAPLRSDIPARIRRSAIAGLPALPTELEVAALLVRGVTSDGHEYHLQVTASSGPSSDATLFTAVPDLELLDALRADQNPGWISITLRAIAQMIRPPGAPAGAAPKTPIAPSPDGP